MTKEQMLSKIKSLGIKTQFKPRWNNEAQLIELNCRKEPSFLNGSPKGTMISFHGNYINIWLPRTKLALKLSKTNNNISCRILTGEAELLIPFHLADTLLKPLGAKVKSNRKGNINNLIPPRK